MKSRRKYVYWSSILMNVEAAPLIVLTKANFFGGLHPGKLKFIYIRKDSIILSCPLFFYIPWGYVVRKFLVSIFCQSVF